MDTPIFCFVIKTSWRVWNLKRILSQERKRDRFPSSTFFPSSTASKKTRQEDIVSAFDPAAIAKKKIAEGEKKKKPQEVQERINNLKIFSYYIAGEARPLITVGSFLFINLLKEIDSRVESVLREIFKKVNCKEIKWT